jgi:hypothetical protein
MRGESPKMPVIGRLPKFNEQSSRLEFPTPPDDSGPANLLRDRAPGIILRRVEEFQDRHVATRAFHF